MAEDNDSGSGPPPNRRRSSFAGQTFADLFGTGRQRPSVSQESSGNNNPTATFPRPSASVAAEAQRRRMSLTTLGISGSPNQTSPFVPGLFRRDSISSANSNSIDESAVEDEVGPAQSQPTTPFARRVSFGAKAFRDVKTSGQSPTGVGGGGGGSGAGGGGGGVSNGGTDRQNGRSSIAQTGISTPSATAIPGSSSSDVVGSGKKTSTPPSAKGRGWSSSPHAPRQTLFTRSPTLSVHYADHAFASLGEGYNWADSFRNRASRSASIVSLGGSPNFNHTRAKSVATMQPPPAAEMPKSNAPDHFQERILKGDFYMD